jgi:probable rRNA maturation factor
MNGVTVQLATRLRALPARPELARWVGAALAAGGAAGEVSIRVVDEEESRALNRDYRARDRPTNVLSFPAALPAEVRPRLLGDLVICAPVVAAEAAAQGKSRRAHWAHMVVHGTLHLLGYGHERAGPAARMEALEARILAGLGFPDPYADDCGRAGGSVRGNRGSNSS